MDPSGKCPWCVGAAVGGVIGGTSNALGVYFGGGSTGDVAKAFVTGAFVGGIFGATGVAAGSLSTWAITGASSGGITAGATTAITGGTAKEILTDTIVGALTGVVTGSLGHRVAINSAIAATGRGASKSTSINRGDFFGGLSGATTSTGISIVHGK